MIVSAFSSPIQQGQGNVTKKMDNLRQQMQFKTGEISQQNIVIQYEDFLNTLIKICSKICGIFNFELPFDEERHSRVI